VSDDARSGSGPVSPQPAVAAAIPVPEPTPVIAPSDATVKNPPGTAAVIGPADRPEIAVGAAFAGGFVVAFILKKITN